MCRLLYVILFSSFFVTPSKADWVDDYMSRPSCSSALANLPGSQVEVMPKKIRAALATVFRSQITHYSGVAEMIHENDLSLPPLRLKGTAILVNKVPYEVLDVLGSGAQGAVYAVEGPDGPVLLKRFHRLAASSQVEGDFYADMRVISLYENFLVVEMVVGPTLDVLYNYEEIDEWGIPSQMGLEIHNFFKDLMDENNEIIDLNTGKVVRFDPV